MFILTLKGLQLFNYSVISKAQEAVQKLSNSSFYSIIIFNKDTALKRYYTKPNAQLTESQENQDSIGKANSNCDPDFTDQLIKWAVQNNISNFAFSKLLKVLSEYGIKGLPKNSKVLLQTKEAEIKVSKVPPGIYTHFGLRNNIKNLILTLIEKDLFKESEISASIFIDQLPIVKLTNQGLWVILGSIEGFTNNIFLVGVYWGYSKPNKSNLFLSEFVKEAKDLCKTGLEINKLNYSVKIKRLICDVPAKSFVLNVKSHSGYSSCTKCNAVGEFKSKKLCFLEKGSPKKDEDFEKNEMYLKDKTCLLEIPNFGVVSNVTLDYMHLVCLGVVQRLLSIWLNKDKYCLFQNSSFDVIKNLALAYPCEFHKKPKSFRIYNQWIANDFRQFLLYYGPVVLKNNLSEKYYDHFLLLHVACRLLCTEASKENIDFGRELLNDFVKKYKELYKTEQITHNIHGLYHLADECTSHGTLDNFSAFPFEKFLTKLKNSMENRRKKLVPQTVLRESYERIFKNSLASLTSDNYQVKQKIKINEDDGFKDFFCYDKLCFKNFSIITSSKGDSYVFLKNGKIVQVTNVLKKKEKSRDHFIAGKEFQLISNFHSGPFKSLKLNMFKVEGFSDTIDLWPVDLIERKGMKVPTGCDESVIISLLDKNF